MQQQGVPPTPGASETFTRLTGALADRYRLDHELGAGGMATVYRAHDLRHDRDIAIKVLHPDLGAALGGDRFLTEIRTTARLQHPHILPLLDSGEANGLLYYVMPLVTGETLRARLERERQLPVDEAIRIAREVADALAHAHEHGIVHRDIKPENILLQGGHASVADFGIALAVQHAGGQRMTQTGLSLGTPQYMSPEQALGERTIDARADIYALAAVTYEMLVGEPPFTGPTVQAIIARVMGEEPRPLVAQRKAIPDHVEDAVLQGLEKLPADRWRSAREFADALTGTAATTTTGRTHATTSRHRVNRQAASWRGRLLDPVTMGLAALALGSLGVAGWSLRPEAREQPGIVRFTISGSGNERTNSLGHTTLAISRDGKTLVYSGVAENRREMLMLRTLDDVSARALPETEDASNPIFSPDGKWIAFVRANQLFKIAVDGARPQLLGPLLGTFDGMSWSSRGYIVISGNTTLYILPESGGQPRTLVTIDRARGQVGMSGPTVVDEHGIVLFSFWSGTSVTGSKVAIASLDTGEPTPLDILGPQPLGISDGILTYVTSGGALMGVPIDVKARKVTGTPVQLVSDVAVNATTGLARASISANGNLFYQTGRPVSQVMSVDQKGAARPLIAESRDYVFPRLSPDGTRLAIAIGSIDRRDIWIYDLSSQTMTRLTTEGSLNDRPEWTPDGKRVLFRSDVGSRTGIWWRPTDMSGPATPMIAGPRMDIFEAVVSPDMRYTAYQLDTAGADVYYRELSGDTTARVVSAEANAIETMPRISPNGRWITFVTNESGRDEVVVQSFPERGGRVQVSAGGGSEPVWSRDGKRLFYRGDGHFMAATVRPGPSFSIASRDTLFADAFQYATNPHANYDVTADGRFIFLRAASGGNMIVAANWGSSVLSRISGTARK